MKHQHIWTNVAQRIGAGNRVIEQVDQCLCGARRHIGDNGCNDLRHLLSGNAISDDLAQA